MSELKKKPVSAKAWKASGKKISLRAGTLLSPVPAVLVTCRDSDGTPNVLTIAWTGIVNSDPAMTYISVRPERHSYEIIKRTGEFVINVPSVHQIRALDLCGVKSGRDTDKALLCGLTYADGQTVSAPLIQECPLALECRVTESKLLGTHEMFLANITAVRADSTVLNETGKLCLERAGLVAYTHGAYYGLGKKYGNFGYSVKKKKKYTGRK